MSQFDPLQRNTSRVGRTLRRWFPDRQIILRSGETVRSLKISTASQVVLSTASLAVGIWLTVTSAVFVGHQAIVEAKETEVERVQTAYKGLLTQVTVYKDRIAGITDSLERNHAHIMSLVDQNLTLDDRLQHMQERLTSTAQERDRIERQSADLAGYIKKLRSDIASAAAVGDERGSLPAAPSERAGLSPAALVDDLGQGDASRARAARERNSLQAELARLEADLDAGGGSDVIATDLDSIEEELHRVVTQRDRAHALRAGMEARVADLERQLREMEDNQLTLFSRFSELAGDKIEAMEQSLDSTGIDLPALLEKTARRFGTGGPFVPERPETEDAGRSLLEQRHDDVHLKLDRLDLLTRLSQTLPLATPMTDYRITSSFGRRSDPFNGRAAVHEGLDMVAAYKTPIMAPGPGKVVYAGWRGRYGRLVEIDHGMGLRTRYGHLSQILVKKGQVVAAGVEIGLLGNSGRSTGAHLHYEVLVNGEPHDPMKFIKAGSDVLFKG